MTEPIKIDPSDLYSIRMLVFIETEPQSNKYHQVILNTDQFKKVSKVVGDCFEEIKDANIRKGSQCFDLQVSDQTYDLPDIQEKV